MSVLRPNAAAVPWTRLELLTPSAVHLPRRRPPTSVFLVTTAKSAPGIRTRTAANARNSVYFDHDMVLTLPAVTADSRSNSNLTLRFNDHEGSSTARSTKSFVIMGIERLGEGAKPGLVTQSARSQSRAGVQVERGALGAARGPRPVHRGGRGPPASRTARAARRGGW